MIKLYQVFESYPLFYQPYIPAILKKLAKIKGLESKIIAYNGDSVKESKVFILPIKYFRKIYNKFNQAFSGLLVKSINLKCLDNYVYEK
jgi:hypothetical protein